MRRMRHKVQDLMNVNKYVRDARADDVTTRRYERESVAGDLESESSSLSLVQAKAKFQVGACKLLHAVHSLAVAQPGESIVIITRMELVTL
jgi:hypothetical protein